MSDEQVTLCEIRAECLLFDKREILDLWMFEGSAPMLDYHRLRQRWRNTRHLIEQARKVLAATAYGDEGSGHFTQEEK